MNNRALVLFCGGQDSTACSSCRDHTLKALQVAMSLGLDSPMVVETPLM